jgi:hypothetical protein
MVGADRLSWIQQIEVDTATNVGRLTFASEDSARRLHGEAVITFRSEPDGTTRRIDGDLVVAVPLIAAAVERRIVTGLVRDLDLEAQAIRDRLSGGARGTG